MVTKFLSEIQALIAGAESKAPDTAEFTEEYLQPFVSSRDTVVATCSRRVKALSHESSLLMQQLEDYQECLRGDVERSAYWVKWFAESSIIESKLRLLKGLIWLCIYDDSPQIMANKHVVIRRGWKIVSCKTEADTFGGLSSVTASLSWSTPPIVRGKN